VYFIIIAIRGGVAREGEYGGGGGQFNAPPNGRQSRGIA